MKRNEEDQEQAEDAKKKGFFGRLFGGFSSSKEKCSESKIISMPEASSKKTKLEERYRKRNRKFRQTVDTNVVSIGFNILEEDAQLAAGDAIF